MAFGLRVFCISATILGAAVGWPGAARAEQAVPAAATPEAEPSLEQLMNRRFPQPVRVGDLIGLPLLDYDDRQLTRVSGVVRDANGKIQLIADYGGWFGWGGHPIAIPIEAVAILGRQIAVLEIPREDFDGLPTWSASAGQTLDLDAKIKIAVTRR